MTDKIKTMMQSAALYVPLDSEGIRVTYCDEDCFYGQGEESGDEYRVYYGAVNLDVDLIYGLVLLNP
jgi:hypothetical protein